MATMTDYHMNALKSQLKTLSKSSGYSVAVCLAELVKECLLADSDDPMHVDGIDFVQLCDLALMER